MFRSSEEGRFTDNFACSGLAALLPSLETPNVIPLKAFVEIWFACRMRFVVLKTTEDFSFGIGMFFAMLSSALVILLIKG